MTPAPGAPCRRPSGRQEFILHCPSSYSSGQLDGKWRSWDSVSPPPWIANITSGSSSYGIPKSAPSFIFLQHLGQIVLGVKFSEMFSDFGLDTSVVDPEVFEVLKSSPGPWLVRMLSSHCVLALPSLAEVQVQRGQSGHSLS